MKTKIISIIAISIVLIITACNAKREIIKKINKDGSVEMTVNVWESDTSYLYAGGKTPFPMHTNNL